MNINNVTVIIPAYKPSEGMIDILKDMSHDGYESIIVVDDGGGQTYSHIFDMAESIDGVTVLHHYINMGKGRALKTGINHYLNNANSTSAGVVTADADGQHLPSDIEMIAQEIVKDTDTMVLGARRVDRSMPLRSKLGNSITRIVFRLVSGTRVYDTQTGLRGIPRAYLPEIMMLSGEKYEYEMSMLMELNNLKLSVKEMEIQTVYIDDNEGSHFNPIVDSWKIYKIILGYLMSSVFSAIVDIVLFSYFYFNVFTGNLLLAIISARVISSLVNFGINRQVLLPKHKEDRNIRRHLIKYYSLALIILVLSYSITYILVNVAGMNPVVSKIICDTLLFIVCFMVQKRYIFN